MVSLFKPQSGGKSDILSACTDAGKSFKTLLPKGEAEKFPEPSEPNEWIQLDFWDPISYLKVLKSIVMVKTTNTSNKVFKILEKHLSTECASENP